MENIVAGLELEKLGLDANTKAQLKNESSPSKIAAILREARSQIPDGDERLAQIDSVLIPLFKQMRSLPLLLRSSLKR